MPKCLWNSSQNAWMIDKNYSLLDNTPVDQLWINTKSSLGINVLKIGRKRALNLQGDPFYKILFSWEIFLCIWNTVFRNHLYKTFVDSFNLFQNLRNHDDKTLFEPSNFSQSEYKTLSSHSTRKCLISLIARNLMARIVTYYHDSENFEINWKDRQMYTDDSETHKKSLTRKVSYNGPTVRNMTHNLWFSSWLRA